MTGLLTSIQAALGLPNTPISFTATGALPSAFAVTELACASIAAAGQAASELLHQQTGRRPELEVDRRLASFWFGTSIRPIGWSVPPLWDPVAGDYTAPLPNACSVPVPTVPRWPTKWRNGRKVSWNRRWWMPVVVPPKCAPGINGRSIPKARQ
jgi:hypothetical protein